MTSTNSQNYLDNLNNISGSYTPNFNDPAISPHFNVLIATLKFPGEPPATAIGELELGQALATDINATHYTGFVSNYYSALGFNPSTIPAEYYDPTFLQSPMRGLYTIFTLANENTYQGLVSDPSTVERFKAVFGDFLKTFDDRLYTTSVTDLAPVTSSGITYTINVANNYENFFNAYLRYLTTTTTVQNPSELSSIFVNLNDVNNISYIQSYQTIYESFNGPVGTLSANPANWTVAQNVFAQRFTAFYNSELAKTSTTTDPGGFFDPSQNLGDWYDYSQNLYYNPLFVPNAVVNDPRSTIILDDVLKALIAMIGVIQSVAAAQANNLNFLSRWQQAYTSKLNFIHTFAAGDNTILGRFEALTPGSLYGNDDWNKDKARAVRNELNSVNQTYISKLQANQQTISDSAKSLQTNVNQSNDAANQQGSVADSILQELSTILSAIFR